MNQRLAQYRRLDRQTRRTFATVSPTELHVDHARRCATSNAERIGTSSGRPPADTAPRPGRSGAELYAPVGVRSREASLCDHRGRAPPPSWGFKLLVCVARPARRRMHHRLWLPHEA